MNAKTLRAAVSAATLVTACVIGAPSARGQSTQALVEDWRATSSYSGVMMDLDAADNVLVVGDTVIGDVVNTRKYSAAGALLWERTYDPPVRVKAAWVSVDPAGNALVAAYAISGSSATPSGLHLLKYDPAGTLLWANVLPGAYARAVRVETDAAGNAYLIGTLFATNAGGSTTIDAVTIKYTPRGRRAWIRLFDNAAGISTEEPNSLAVSPDGARIAVVGRIATSFFTVVYDADGNLAWQNVQPNLYSANDVAFGPGGVLYVGAASWTPTTSNRMTIVKFDANGGLVWTNAYPDGDFVYRLAVDSIGNVLAAGVDQATTGMPYLNWMVLKTDPEGARLWSRGYDAHLNNDERPFFMVLDSADAVYVTGEGGPGPSVGMLSTTRMVTLKHASDGSPVWANFSDSGAARCVRLGSDDGLYVLGQGQMTVVRYHETGLPDVAPVAPSNLTASCWFTGVRYECRLNWTDNSTNEFAFEIERCTGGRCRDFAVVGRTPGENASSFADQNGVAAGTTYRYRIRAFGFSGRSAPSYVAVGNVPLFQHGDGTTAREPRRSR